MSLITLAIFLGSLVGIMFVFYRKIPLLLALDEQGEKSLRQIVVSSARNFRGAEKLRAIASDKIIQKALSKTRIAALKTENQTGEWLEKLRSRSAKRKETFSHSYWDQFRKKAQSKKEDGPE